MLMQTVIGQLVRNAKKVTADKLWMKSMDDELMRKMKILNVHDQLDKKGVYSDGKDTPDYSPITIEMKKRENKLYSHMNFNDTGDTRASIKYSPIKDGIKIDIRDTYDLLNIYSPNIIGLTDENKESLHPNIIENIQNQILSITG